MLSWYHHTAPLFSCQSASDLTSKKLLLYTFIIRKEGIHIGGSVTAKKRRFNKKLLVKIKESLSAVLPITAIVLLLHFTIAPMPAGMLWMFLTGAVLLVLGMGLFTLGADTAMMPRGERVGAHLTKSRKLGLLIGVCFVIGVLITVAEPDLQVLADQVPAVPNNALIAAVSLGVGLFLVTALLRIVFQKKLRYMLLGFYALVFALAAFTPSGFLSVAFDSGGVTTGPITVPFIMALGIGVASVRGGRSSRDDSFGLVALCSIGPILAVMIMGLFYDSSSGAYGAEAVEVAQSGGELLRLFAKAIPKYAGQVAIALSPILVFFLIFELIFLKLPRRRVLRICVGVMFAYVGLVLFLSGVNVGFMPAGSYLGGAIASLPYNWALIPLGMLIGFFIVAAEPAVHVLNDQVETISGGAISRRAMLISLSLGVAASLGLAMVRVLTGLSIWYFLVPGYAISLALTFFVPDIFTAIAFDSGGVASGPMTATFLLPFAMGACEALGGNILTDAFGIVAMVAMTPLITIQIMGLIYRIRTRKREQPPVEAPDDEVIDL